MIVPGLIKIHEGGEGVEIQGSRARTHTLVRTVVTIVLYLGTGGRREVVFFMGNNLIEINDYFLYIIIV
jgi:hypothetical protein